MKLFNQKNKIIKMYIAEHKCKDEKKLNHPKCDICKNGGFGKNCDRFLCKDNNKCMDTPCDHNGKFGEFCNLEKCKTIGENGKPELSDNCDQIDKYYCEDGKVLFGEICVDKCEKGF